MLHRLVGRTPQGVDEESLEEEIRAIVSEGHREGLLEEDARENDRGRDRVRRGRCVGDHDPADRHAHGAGRFALG